MFPPRPTLPDPPPLAAPLLPTPEALARASDGRLRLPTITVEQVMPDGSVREYESTGHYFAAAIEATCVHTKGRWAGKPFKLLAWQRDWLLELFEVVEDEEDTAERVRRFRWALLLIPKKNGKTELLAALAVVMLLFDLEPNPIIAIGSSTEHQANLLFGAARFMCSNSPVLKEVVECRATEIVVRADPESKIVRVTGAPGSNDGPSWSHIFLDELHVFKGDQGEGLFNVLTNGIGARDQPLVLMISTAGDDEESLCGRWRARGHQIADGLLKDDTYFFREWAAPEHLDYRTEEAWRAANPSYGITVRARFYLDQLGKKTPAVFKRYFVGIWTSGEEQWLPDGAWDACRLTAEIDGEQRPVPVSFRTGKGHPIDIAIDASTKNDSTAVIAGQWQDGRQVLRAWIWERPVVAAAHGAQAKTWSVPLGEVEAIIKGLFREHTVGRIGADPHLLNDFLRRLEQDRLPVEEVPQSNARMVPGCTELYRRIIDRVIAHDGDPKLARHMANAVAEQVLGGDGGFKIRKGKTSKKVDGAVACAILAYLTPPKAAKPRSQVFV